MSQLKESLKDKEEHNHILFALACAQWEVSALDTHLYNQVKQIIDDNTDIDLWKEPGDDAIMLKSRQKEIHKFLQKISKTKATPKARQKPPVPVTSEYINGTCLAFQFPDKTYGGVALLDSDNNLLTFGQSL